MTNEDINKLIEIYQQVYFTHDEPVPFKDKLMLYPVKVKDYYKYYSALDILRFEKNEDPSGVGIPMTHLGYLIYKSKQDDEEGRSVAHKIISMLELVFQIKNGIYCDCDEEETYISYDDLLKEYAKIRNDIAAQESEDDDENAQQLKMLQFNARIHEARVCPKCGKERKDIIRYETDKDEKVHMFVGETEITKDDYDLLRQLIQFQNNVDYDNEIIDPELKAELELKAQLQNADLVPPTLEKQEACIIASTAYTYDTIQNLTIRHLSYLLRIIDSKMHYFAYKQGELSGMVTFKEGTLQHWLYGVDKKSKTEDMQSLDELREKLGNTTKM